MSVSESYVPKLCRHRSSKKTHKDRAYVKLNGKVHYCGPWGSKEAKKEYARLIKLFQDNDGYMPGDDADLTIADLIVRFVEYADGFYRKPDGTPTTQPHNIRLAMRPLDERFGKERPGDFGPVKLKAVRQAMIHAGRVRSQINKAVWIIIKMFKWAAENEVVPGSLVQDLRTVEALQSGRSKATESEPVRPVPDDQIDALKDHVGPPVWAMIQLQLHTGMRPGEVVQMTTGRIDRTGKVWVYRPARHKSEHLDKERRVYIGPKGQSVLLPFLKADPDAPLFSPAETMKEVRAKRNAKRNPKWEGQGNRPGTNLAEQPKRKPGDRYTVTAYGHAVVRGCERAFGMPAEYRDPQGKKAKAKEAETPGLRDERRRKANEWRAKNTWNPNQLRHTAATRIRGEFGLEAAQVLLGHERADVTQVYAERDEAKAVAVVAQAG